MKYSKTISLIVVAISTYVYFGNNFILNAQEYSASDTVISTLGSIKSALKNKYSPDDIEAFVRNANSQGATGIHVAKMPKAYDFIKDMGWFVNDSSGRQVFKVLFTFDGNIPISGRYIGPTVDIGNEKVAQQIHSMHKDILNQNLISIDQNKYDLNDDCIANIKRFGGTKKTAKSTVIIVECNP